MDSWNGIGRADETPPVLMYVDRDCCREQGPTSVERLFDEWVQQGMNVRLDPWHWMHRFDAAVRTDSHPKYAIFKSALSGVVFAYNRGDLDLLIKAVRAGSPNSYEGMTDSDIMKRISRYQLQHYVRRVTAQQTYTLVDAAIEELKGDAGLDENGISLFKSPESINNVWDRQKKHLECLQDPPDMSMYFVKKHVQLNKIELPYYGCHRGNNSLEGFHAHLPRMIPGDHCAINPFQIYLLAGLARWNANRESDALNGGKGRQHMVYETAILHRLNTRCKALFGDQEIAEINFRPQIPLGSELIGTEYLLKQSTTTFNTDAHYEGSKEALRSEDDACTPNDAAVTDGHEMDDDDDDDDDDGYTSDAEDDTVPQVSKLLHGMMHSIL